MNTKHFDYFIAIAETGSLSSASRRLGISQPVLSRYLANLEKKLGTPLFLWNNQHFHMTQAGEIYLSGIRRMKELQTQMLRSLGNLQGIEAQTLSIGMSPYRGGQELAAFYPGLLSRYPSLNLSVTEGSAVELLEKLRCGDLSAFISLYDYNLMPDTKVASFIQSELLLILPNYHPLCTECHVDHNEIGFLSAEQFSSLSDVLFVISNTASTIGQVIEQVCQRYHFYPQSLLHTSNAITIRSLLSSGNYAGFQLQNAAPFPSTVRRFHLPHPVYLYSGMIFLNEHKPAEPEQYLYYLEYLQAKKDTPELLCVNTLGQQLLDLAACQSGR